MHVYTLHNPEKMYLSLHKIGIESFLKDHVTLKTGFSFAMTD